MGLNFPLHSKNNAIYFFYTLDWPETVSSFYLFVQRPRYEIINTWEHLLILKFSLVRPVFYPAYPLQWRYTYMEFIALCF